MSSRRLPWLLALLVALLVLRWLAPPGGVAKLEVVQALPREGLAVDSRPTLTSGVPAAPAATRVARLEDLPDRPGNAFAVRQPPAPVRVALPALPPPFVGPPLPPQPAPQAALPPAPTIAPLPAPPLQVIGTWDDGVASGVFIASPNGTLLARTGSVLLAEYTVVRITSQQVSLLHIASKREIQLPIPQVPLTPPRP